MPDKVKTGENFTKINGFMKKCPNLSQKSLFFKTIKIEDIKSRSRSPKINRRNSDMEIRGRAMSYGMVNRFRSKKGNF